MLSTYLSTVFFHQGSLCSDAPPSFSFSRDGCKQGTWKPKRYRLQLRQELVRDGNRPKKLDSKINQEALKLGAFGTAAKTTNTAWSCCPFAFCAHEMPLLMDAVCNTHWSCSAAFCAVWWLGMKVPSDPGQAPSASSPDASCQPRVQPLTHPWASALGLPASAASTWNHSQNSDTRDVPGWVQGWDIHPAGKPHKKDLCLGLYLWHKEHCQHLHSWHLHTGRTWNKTCASERAKGRGWSQDGKAQKPPPHCPRNFPWLTRAPLLFGSILLPLLAVRTTVIPDGLCSHVSPTHCARTRVLTCFV